MERYSIDESINSLCAAIAALLLSYLLVIIVMLNALGLAGWDLAGGFVLCLSFPGVLGVGLFHLFRPLKHRHLYGRGG